MSAIALDREQCAYKTKFLRLLRDGVRHKLVEVGKKEDIKDRKNSISASTMPLATIASWHTLTWRDAYSTAPYFVEHVGEKTLRVQQMLQGELNGFGTGFTVWPAACIMIKFLKHRFESLQKFYVLELGSGTGAVGLAAALLDADLVVLSDVSIVQPFLHKNVQICRQENPDIHVVAESFDWSTPAITLLEKYKRNPDIILISDCILPKIYPIEPLVNALSNLIGSCTTTYISYEHRYYDKFDPKLRFWSLMERKGFHLRTLTAEEYHPLYRAADIEIWEVTRRLPAT